MARQPEQNITSQKEGREKEREDGRLTFVFRSLLIFSFLTIRMRRIGFGLLVALSIVVVTLGVVAATEKTGVCVCMCLCVRVRV